MYVLYFCSLADLECAGSILHSQDHTKASLRRSVRNNRQKSTLRTSKRAERLRKISVPYNKFSVLDLYNYKVFKCAKVKRQANSVTEMSTTRFTVLRTTNKSLLCEDSADKRYGSTEVDHSYGVTYKSPSPNGQSSHDIHPKLKGKQARMV